MRALYFTDTYPPQVNGVSVVTHLSVRGLMARGWDVGVVAPEYPDTADVFGAAADQVVMTLPSIPCPAYPDLRLAAPSWARVRRLVREFRPDVVHCCTEFVIGWLGRRAARAAGLPIVTSYHTDFGRYLASYGVPVLSGVVDGYLTRFHRSAHQTLTPSGVVQRELVERGIRQAQVWGCGVDAETFRPDRATAECRGTLGGAGRFVFLHVGRLAPEKSVDRLLAGFARCREVLGDDIRLVIAGEGPSRPELERIAPPGVQFVGFLDRATRLAELYASADAFVFASETETLGLVLLEAMASGLPVVAVPAGGVADHLRHGVNGLAWKGGGAVDHLASHMVELATTPSLRESLAAGARATAAALTWDVELDRLDAIYRGLLPSRALPPSTLAPSVPVPIRV
ncbi:MAG: glycosyltransferase family 1 protein [Gemmatimonadales bacterium]|nr:glycosyltransferase family 1 protein [Gemmatimonadales bacterium]